MGLFCLALLEWARMGSAEQGARSKAALLYTRVNANKQYIYSGGVSGVSGTCSVLIA